MTAVEGGVEGGEKPAAPQQAPTIAAAPGGVPGGGGEGSLVEVGGLTELRVGLPEVRLADDAISVLVDAAKGL